MEREQNIENKKGGKKVLTILIILIVLCFVTAAILFGVYNSNLKAVTTEDNIVNIEVKTGATLSTISTLLEEQGVIKSATAMKIYCKLNNVSNLQAGIYELNSAEDMPTVVGRIANGEITSNEIRLTFIEGKTIKDFAKVIADKTNNTEEDVFDLLENEEYIDSLIDEYWFIDEVVKDEDIYYPLEGYLLPDTYNFENKDVSVEKIFEVMLDHLGKILEPYKNMEMRYSVHEYLTLASMAEREAKSLEDRKEVVGVFVNRLDIGMNLGSDVTTYYAFGIDMGERDLYQKELDTENPYNTRGPNMIGKLPIGPICNPSKDAIVAAFEYTETEALYFVADKYGDVYFTRNDEEHVQMIRKLKDDGLWYTYD